MAVKLATLSTLEQLEQEMAAAGRAREEEALREVRRLLVHSKDEFLTTGEAAERLGVSLPTVKEWLRRGALDGGRIGGRWWVSKESVEQQVALRAALKAVADEGFPTYEEIQELYSRKRKPVAS